MMPKSQFQEFAQLHLAGDKKIMSYVKDGDLRVGSNNWAVAPLLSANGKPIVLTQRTRSRLSFMVTRYTGGLAMKQ
ncbi:MAG: hypothetical protein JRF08_08440 [Deltaproteobacteria bacterium]|nr:hypothetical protein [Deltaproteobacteria bacterium]